MEELNEAVALRDRKWDSLAQAPEGGPNNTKVAGGHHVVSGSEPLSEFQETSRTPDFLLAHIKPPAPGLLLKTGENERRGADRAGKLCQEKDQTLEHGFN